jgi:hypothetical protein
VDGEDARMHRNGVRWESDGLASLAKPAPLPTYPPGRGQWGVPARTASAKEIDPAAYYPVCGI